MQFENARQKSSRSALKTPIRYLVAIGPDLVLPTDRRCIRLRSLIQHRLFEKDMLRCRILVEIWLDVMVERT